MPFDNVCWGPVWLRNDDRYRRFRRPFPGGPLLNQHGAPAAPRDLAP